MRQADVLAGVPDTDRWIVAGRSDTREDRIEVRRTWLSGAASGRWAMVLSFAAFRQSLDTSLTVGTSVHADLHRYPGPALRGLVGERFGEPEPLVAPPASTIVEACDEIGGAVALEPWLERYPATVLAAPTGTAGAGCSPTTLERSRWSQHHARWRRCSRRPAVNPPRSPSNGLPTA